MELRHLRYFVAVAEELHFGRAAARLRIAQPALSRQIRQLEDEVGADLFDRGARALQLTAAGRDFLEGARETLAAAERTVRRARRAWGNEAGRLSVAFVPAILDSLEAVRILRRFRERHPAVRVEVSALQTVEQWEALRHGRVQVGFLYDPPADADLVCEPLWQQEILLAVPADDPLARGPGPIPLALAAHEPFLWFDRAAAPFPHDMVRRLFESRGLTMRVVEEAASEEARLSLVAGGLGITLVPGSADTAPRPGIALRRVQEIDFGVQVFAAHAGGRTSRVTGAFLGEMRGSLEEWNAMPPRSQTGT
jgi:LysR family transcriptional regulator, benzoate and cis,cis-muconate-responsive activator of ben and cat genes